LLLDRLIRRCRLVPAAPWAMNQTGRAAIQRFNIELKFNAALAENLDFHTDRCRRPPTLRRRARSFFFAVREG
jgi:hypothetical protein